jgi:hypothetical protein
VLDNSRDCILVRNIGILLGVSDALAELRARQIVQKMRSLKNDVLGFSEHAKFLNRASQNIDSRVLMEEADNLLKKLMAARVDFQEADANVNSVRRSLSSTIPRGGGIAPAALWGNELRAASKQFVEAVHTAENKLRELYQTSEAGMNSPTRTSTGDPSGAFDVLMTFVEMLTRIIEHYRGKRN